MHAADLHLDSPFKGLTQLPSSLFEEVRQSTFHAFDTLINKAIDYQIDFLLLVGDLFDHEEQSLKAQIHLRNAFLKLQTNHIQVYLSYGNHDFIHKNNHQVTFPENVSVFKSEQVQSFFYERDGERLAEINGFSYESRAVTESKIDEYPSRNQNVPFQIGMLHGAIYGNTVHHSYAPFQMEELKGKGYDYWALGHIHQRAILNETPPIIYPGNIQGRHRREPGDKGCYLVEMTSLETTVTYIPLYQIEFFNVEVDLSGVEDINDAENKLWQSLKQQKKTAMLIHLTWKNVAPNQFGARTGEYLSDLIELFNDQEIGVSPWQFIYKEKVQFKKIEEQKINRLFLEDAQKAFNMLDVQKELSELLQHPQGRKFLDLPTDQALLAEAEETLMRRLFQKGEGD